MQLKKRSPKFRLAPKLRYLARELPGAAKKFYYSWDFAQLVICIDLLICYFVIKYVNYTEIDFSTYIAQVQQIFNTTPSSSSSSPSYNFNYSQIEGPSGPLVYPAGHVYVYYIIKQLTDGGSDIRSAQYLFMLIYFAQLCLVYKIYSHKRVRKYGVPSYVFIILCFSSYRIHSIYLLRLFNDPIAVLVAYISFYMFMAKRYTISALLFSFAVSIKMNILLYAPAFALIFYEEVGLVQSMINAIYAAILQLAVASPFLYTDYQGYINRAFDFKRVFLHKWTVNWRFLDEETFTSERFHMILLGIQLGQLIFLFSNRLFKRFTPKRDDPIMTLFITNFIGIACSRSLHYQFYVWYFHSLPLLVWATKFSFPLKVLILGCVEFSWNQFPSTSFSSLLLHFCHIMIMIGLQTRGLRGSPSAAALEALKNKNKKKKR